MSANLLGSDFNNIFTSMSSYFDNQKVGETTTQQSTSKPAGVIETIKKYWNGLTGIEKGFLVFIVLVIFVLIIGYIMGD